MKMTQMKKLCLCAICIALCYVLPIAFHSVGLGGVLSPMHIPVLLCGLVCGGGYGAVCGVVGPVLSSLLSGMPPVTALFSMIPELMVYGLAGGILMARVRSGKMLADVYISLIGAMIFGRIAGGIAKAIFVTVMATGDGFTIAMWVSSYFVSAVPGIIAHLVLIPILVMTLVKARVIPAWYKN